MNCIAIPAEVFESREYAQLTLSERMFLLDLYIVMNDVECFTIDINRPEDYRQSKGVWLPRKINRLIECGFLVVTHRRKVGRDHYTRVFRFKYSPNEELQAA